MSLNIKILRRRESNTSFTRLWAWGETASQPRMELGKGLEPLVIPHYK